MYSIGVRNIEKEDTDMINLLLNTFTIQAAVLAMLAGFALTWIFTALLKSKLPTDIGRAYAVNAAAAKGKPRGAGIIFVLVFAVVTFLAVPFSFELLFYLILLILAMLSGFLDDASRAPWGEYKKGLIDLVISLLISVNFVCHNSTDIRFLIIGTNATLPVWLYILLGTILVWVSINVTNCTDGVDGLSTVLALISLGGFLCIFRYQGNLTDYSTVLILMGCLAAYLLYNASPSILLMGDAGSRTIGVFFAIVAMKTGAPLLYIPLCLVFILDGGLGLIKVSLLRFLKIHILKNVRTPLHDFTRKTKGWSDTQTVLRFAVIHLVIVLTTLCLVLI